MRLAKISLMPLIISTLASQNRWIKERSRCQRLTKRNTEKTTPISQGCHPAKRTKTKRPCWTISQVEESLTQEIPSTSLMRSQSPRKEERERRRSPKTKKTSRLTSKMKTKTWTTSSQARSTKSHSCQPIPRSKSPRAQIRRDKMKERKQLYNNRRTCPTKRSQQASRTWRGRTTLQTRINTNYLHNSSNKKTYFLK